MACSVLILDDDADVLASLADLARSYTGCECLTADSFDGLVALGDRARACDVAVLDINLGAGCPTGIDAYHWLRDGRFAGRIYFLTGHASNHPLVEQARRIGHVEIIEKPAAVGVLEHAFSG